MRLRKKYSISDFCMFDAFNSEEDLNIVYTAKEFHLAQDIFDDRYKFVSKNLYKSDSDNKFDFEKLDDKSLIYISSGTILNKKIDFYSKCFNSLHGDKYQVVLSIGPNPDISEFGEIPNNFIVSNFVPQQQILERASLFITHGSPVSVNDRLIYGVPMVVFPQGHAQFICAETIDMLGTGIFINNGGGYKRATDEILEYIEKMNSS